MDQHLLDSMDEDELVDAADDLQALVDAIAAGVLDVGLGAHMLLMELLDDVQEALATAPIAREAVELGGL
jgi:hypothetical protein